MRNLQQPKTFESKQTNFKYSAPLVIMAKLAVFFIGIWLVAAVVAMSPNAHMPDGQKNGGPEKTDDDVQREWPYNGVTIGKRTSASRNDFPSRDLAFEERVLSPWQWFEESQVFTRLLAKMVAKMVTMEENPQPKITDTRDGDEWPRNGVLIGK